MVDMTAAVDSFISKLQEVVSNSQTQSVITGHRHFSAVLNASAISPLVMPNESLSAKLFLVKVYADCNGNMEDIVNAGCGYDVNPCVGLAYNGYPIYSNIMNLVSSFKNDCDSDIAPIMDLMLKYYGFQFAVKCSDFCKAAKYLDMLTNNTTVLSGGGSHCGCHGTH